MARFGWPAVFLFVCLVSPLRAQQPGRPAGDSYQLKPSPKTVAWGYYDAKTPPALRIKSGDTVEIQTLVTSSRERFETAGLWPDRVEPAWREIYEQVKDHGPGNHMLTGPIYVEGAEPGDVLEVRIQKIRLAIPYALNAFSPGRGFLPEDFPYERVKVIPLDEKRMVAQFAEGIEIPLHPFFGSMGVAPPASAGRISSAPPWVNGGNLDNKELVAGTTLFIPVHAPARSFRRVMATGARATGKWTSPRWKPRSSARSSLSSARTCACAGRARKRPPSLSPWDWTKTLTQRRRWRSAK